MWFNGYVDGVHLAQERGYYSEAQHARRLWNEGGENEALRPIDKRVCSTRDSNRLQLQVMRQSRESISTSQFTTTAQCSQQ